MASTSVQDWEDLKSTMISLVTSAQYGVPFSELERDYRDCECAELDDVLRVYGFESAHAMIDKMDCGLIVVPRQVAAHILNLAWPPKTRQHSDRENKVLDMPPDEPVIIYHRDDPRVRHLRRLILGQQFSGTTRVGGIVPGLVGNGRAQPSSSRQRVRPRPPKRLANGIARRTPTPPPITIPDPPEPKNPFTFKQRQSSSDSGGSAASSSNGLCPELPEQPSSPLPEDDRDSPVDDLLELRDRLLLVFEVTICEDPPKPRLNLAEILEYYELLFEEPLEPTQFGWDSLPTLLFQFQDVFDIIGLHGMDHLHWWINPKGVFKEEKMDGSDAQISDPKGGGDLIRFQEDSVEEGPGSSATLSRSFCLLDLESPSLDGLTLPLLPVKQDANSTTPDAQ